jgi:GNAT superfamily N-acetyltransferase
VSAAVSLVPLPLASSPRCAGAVTLWQLDKVTPSRALNFVRSSWTNHQKDLTRHRRQHILDVEYWQLHSRRVDRLLARPGVEVLVASPVGDRDLVCGWLCAERAGEETVCHYVYVASSFRRWGISLLLAEELGDGPVICTAWTPNAVEMARNHRVPSSWSFDPFWLPKGEV